MNPHERTRNVGIAGGWKQSQEQTIKEIEEASFTLTTSRAEEVPSMCSLPKVDLATNTSRRRRTASNPTTYSLFQSVSDRPVKGDTMLLARKVFVVG
jgi:hypothetical protein